VYVHESEISNSDFSNATASIITIEYINIYIYVYVQFLLDKKIIWLFREILTKYNSGII
jgi:hypothetical protein